MAGAQSQREPLPVAGAFDDDLVAGVGESVEGAGAEDGIVEKTEPFLHGPVGGDDEAGDAVSADDQFEEVGGLLGGEAVEAEVVEDEQESGMCVPWSCRPWLESWS